MNDPQTHSIGTPCTIALQSEGACGKWILVAGSGNNRLAEKLVETSRLLGRGLAEVGFGLISGGWPGVDHIVARAFAEAVKASGGRLSARLMQFRERGHLPDFPGGQYISAASDDAAWRLSIEMSNAVVLVGGLGGTRDTGRLARQLGKAVLPVADTHEDGHEDAYRFYFEMVREWDAAPVLGLTREDFNSLGDAAPGVALEVIRLLELLFGKQTTTSPAAPQSFDAFLSHNSKDKPAVRALADALDHRGLKVWLDEQQLVPGRPWQEAVEQIVATTKSALVLVAKDGIGPWQDREMRGCLSEFVERGLPVIPVLLPGAPTKPALPIFLKQFTWVDLRGGLTKEGLDRLVWGITGTKP